MLPIFVALLAGLAVILVFAGLVGSSGLNPIQARLTQLGSMQAKSLEEIELQQPLFERTLRPLAGRLAGLGQRMTSPQKQSKTELRLAMAGNPGGLRTSDFLGMKLVVAAIVAGLAVLFGFLRGDPGFGVLTAVPGAGLGFFLPEFWLGRRIRARKEAILLAIPDTLDLLTISV